VSIEVGRGADAFEIAGNRLALTRLFENLLENARRYGGGLVLIRVTPVKEGLFVDIIDDGPGIPTDELDRIFDPFVRGEATRKEDAQPRGNGEAQPQSQSQPQGGIHAGQAQGGAIQRGDGSAAGAQAGKGAHA
jgi:K+-sensing histidine kinase KdpD